MVLMTMTATTAGIHSSNVLIVQLMMIGAVRRKPWLSPTASGLSANMRYVAQSVTWPVQSCA